MIILFVPFIGPPTNEFYAGMNIHVRRKLVEKWHNDIAWLVKEQNIKPLEKEYYPATVQVYGIFGPGRKQYDANGLMATGKLIVDGLVKADILKNDSPKYVRNEEYIPQKGAETMTIMKIYYDDFYYQNHTNYNLRSREGLIKFVEAMRNTLR